MSVNARNRIGGIKRRLIVRERGDVRGKLLNTAQGIEAATAAETRRGSVHESPVLEEDAP
jgi:hypothetical protein